MPIDFTIKDHVAYVTINRPERMNAIDRVSHNELERIWLEIENNDTVRAVILSSTGDRAFCAGADMKQTGDEEKSGLEYWAQHNPNGFGGLSMRTTLDVPVIAKVNGFALGGGFEMLLG